MGRYPGKGGLDTGEVSLLSSPLTTLSPAGDSNPLPTVECDKALHDWADQA